MYVMCVSVIGMYHSHLIPEGVAEASQIFLRVAHVLPKLFSHARVFLLSISGVNAINHVVALRHPCKKKRGAILLFCPGHHTKQFTIII
jgi:hypothetical protein